MTNIQMQSIEVKAETRSIRVKWTRELAEDIKQFSAFSQYSGYLLYRLENNTERLIIEKHITFDDEYSDSTELIYKLDKRLLRKIKLLILKNDSDSAILENFIKKSVEISNEDILTRKLSKELSNSIDKEILKNLWKL